MSGPGFPQKVEPPGWTHIVALDDLKAARSCGFKALAGKIAMQRIAAASDSLKLRIRRIDVFNHGKSCSQFRGEFDNRKEGNSFIHQQVVNQRQKQNVIELSASAIEK